MIDTKQIPALIHLMDDPDEQIFTHVRDQLLDCGSSIIPILENSWSNTDLGLLFQDRMAELIHDIQFKEIQINLQNWMNSDDKDLIEGAYLLAKYQFPDLNKAQIVKEIETIKQTIWLELNDHQTIFEKIQIFNHVFYEIFAFKGNIKNYHAPKNSFINEVLTYKKGNPLSLSIIYSYIGQQLGLPLYGVNLPNHFIVACMDESNLQQYVPQKNNFGVLFYINCFSKGTILDFNEIEKYLKEANLENDRMYFEPCSNSQIMIRMCSNLIFSYQEIGNLNKVNELKLLKSILSSAI